MSMRRAVFVLCLLGLLPLAASAHQPRGRGADEPVGACYLRFRDGVQCVGVTTHGDCTKRCDERVCDEAVWFVRLSCSDSIGYGG
jgi:hypothetical protein